MESGRSGESGTALDEALPDLLGDEGHEGMEEPEGGLKDVGEDRGGGGGVGRVAECGP